MNNILRLNAQGIPTAWLSLEQAANLYVKLDVIWELGDKRFQLTGGINRANGERSKLKLSPIIATRSAGIYSDIHREKAPSLSNKMLFRRDDHRCMYCGNKGSALELTRDHVVPTSRGGKDIWENVVAACARCNNFKADRCPEEAGMSLLAIPFRPNIFEAMYLAQHRVLEDQMKYLRAQFTSNREWRAA